MRARIISSFAYRALSIIASGILTASVATAMTKPSASGAIDFDRDIRPILSENCYKCHGPDDESRKAGLRLDQQAGATKPAKSGKVAIVPGSASKSELIARVTAEDPDDRMPPLKTGKKLSPQQIENLRQWIDAGAKFAVHWAYVKPTLPQLPIVKDKAWMKNPIDRFILARLEKEGLRHSPRADRYTLIRRVSLDLTGLPPSLEEVDKFIADKSARAYEQLVDRLLKKPAFGEHWARMWLDLARYADSAGYADDPPRTIWAYRDWVIRAFNSNKPFDRFTIEQIAGDLLADADEDDEIASAFHRNTMTNNEGGTSDEEFRNAAVVDRVNTTMSVWMGTTMGCAQCHTHKYDPITQQEYFKFFAFFNNTEDADLKDESPVLELYSAKQKRQRREWKEQIANLEHVLDTATPELTAQQAEWEQGFPREQSWDALKPLSMKTRDGGSATPESGNAVKVSAQQRAERYTFELALQPGKLAGLRLEALPGEADTNREPNRDYLITHISARLIAPETNATAGRYIRIEIPGKDKILSLAEVQVFVNGTNVAPQGEATQSSTAFEGPAKLAIDGNTDGDYDAKSTTHTEPSENPWWEVDLKQIQSIERVVIWNRTDHELHTRLAGCLVTVLDEKKQVLWQRTVTDAPKPSIAFSLNSSGPLEFAAAVADTNSPSTDLKVVLVEPGKGKKKGWAIEREDGRPHHLILLPAHPESVPAGSRLELTVDQFTEREHAPSGLLRFSASGDEHLSEYARVPDSVMALLAIKPGQRTKEQAETVASFYRHNVAPGLMTQRAQLKKTKQDLANLAPETTVPIMRELHGKKRRVTHVELRGSYQALAEQVSEAVPAAFHPLPKGEPLNRLTLAKWLVARENPLTARVIANRFWEQIFGIGIVRTCEDFGTQGDRPTHPELLDWLAIRLMDSGWNVKDLLKLIVTSEAYCQSSVVGEGMAERDPDNTLLSRGPRFRASAEEVRDQALAVSGLLSSKMYGPPVRPPQPSLGLAAAFGGSFDWKTSEGEDRYRRAIYTEWRRTSPYPSMATFDAPNREVCALRRPRSNTPLQALVTLNDPVYVEAAQALGNRMAARAGSVEQKLRYGFRLCLIRPPAKSELTQLAGFYDAALREYDKDAEAAGKLAGEAKNPKTAAQAAAWTAVGNILLNLDETLMKP